MKLTPKQQRFVEAYAGNGVEAARAAGYKGGEATLAAVAYENLRKPQIAEAIEARQEVRLSKLIATREDRQKFWTEVMQGDAQDVNARLKASELLGKSEADFTEKVDVNGNMTISIAINGIKPRGAG